MVKNISCYGRNIIYSYSIYGLYKSLIRYIYLVFMLAVNLLIIGIESIVHEASGKRNLASYVSSATTTTNSHFQ